MSNPDAQKIESILQRMEPLKTEGKQRRQALLAHMKTNDVKQMETSNHTFRLTEIKKKPAITYKNLAAWIPNYPGGLDANAFTAYLKQQQAQQATSEVGLSVRKKR